MFVAKPERAPAMDDDGSKETTKNEELSGKQRGRDGKEERTRGKDETRFSGLDSALLSSPSDALDTIQ